MTPLVLFSSQGKSLQEIKKLACKRKGISAIHFSFPAFHRVTFTFVFACRSACFCQWIESGLVITQQQAMLSFLRFEFSSLDKTRIRDNMRITGVRPMYFLPLDLASSILEINHWISLYRTFLSCYLPTISPLIIKATVSSFHFVCSLIDQTEWYRMGNEEIDQYFIMQWAITKGVRDSCTMWLTDWRQYECDGDCSYISSGESRLVTTNIVELTSVSSAREWNYSPDLSFQPPIESIASSIKVHEYSCYGKVESVFLSVCHTQFKVEKTVMMKTLLLLTCFKI